MHAEVMSAVSKMNSVTDFQRQSGTSLKAMMQGEQLVSYTSISTGRKSISAALQQANFKNIYRESSAFLGIGSNSH
jgi:hypothetical protein